jgi:hypothetical protein
MENTIHIKIESNLKFYVVVYYNRFANEIQSFRNCGINEFRAGRDFYRKHDRKMYHDCIHQIIRIR